MRNPNTDAELDLLLQLILQNFPDNATNLITPAMARQGLEGLAQATNAAKLRLDGLTTNQVFGSLFRVPTIVLVGGVPTVDIALIEPRRRILGMEILAVNGTDATQAAAGVRADPITFQLVAYPTGTLDALIDEKPTTSATVKARIVRTSGTDAQKLAEFTLLVLSQDTFLKGEVVKWVFPTGETRLLEWRANSVGLPHPTPTGLDSDPVYAPFALLSQPVQGTNFRRLSQAQAVALDDDFQVAPGQPYAVELGQGRYVDLVGTENGRFPTLGRLNGEAVRVNVHNGYVELTGPEQVSYANLLARFADTPPLPEKLYGITARPGGLPALVCRFDDVSAWAAGGVTTGMLVSETARAAGLPGLLRYDLAANQTQPLNNTAPLFVARRDDGTQRTDFLTLRAAVFWANGNAYGGTGGYVTVNRVGPDSNALLGHGTVVDLANQPLNLGGADLHLYAGAVIKNNRLIYNGQVVLRAGAQVGTSIQGGVVAGAIVASSDYGGVPLTLDNVIVADYGQGGFATAGAAQLVLRNGSRLLYPAGAGANVVTEPDAGRFPVVPPSLYGNQLVLDVTPGGTLAWVVATAVGPPVRKKQFVLIGTSLTKGWYNGVDHPASDLATLLTTKNTDTSVSFLNIGHSGWSAQDFLDNFSTCMAQVDFTVADDYYFIIDHAINDGYGNASVATTWARLQSIHQQVRAYHVKVAGTIAVTMTATTYAATDGLPHPAPGAWRAFCDGINTQIRAFAYDTSAAGLGAIAVCDVGAFPNFRYTTTGTVSASGTMQADELHHTPIGYDQKADIELRTIKGVVATGGFGFPISAAGTGLRLTNLTAKTDLTPAGLAGAACLTGYAVMELAAGANGAYFVWSTNSPNPALKTSVCYYGPAFGGIGRGEGLGSNCYDANAARTAGVIPASVKTLVVVKLYANHPEKLSVSIAGSPAVVTATGTQQSLAFSATLTVGGSTGTTDANLDYLQAGNQLFDFFPVVRETTFDEDLQAGALFSYANEL